MVDKRGTMIYIYKRLQNGYTFLHLNQYNMDKALQKVCETYISNRDEMRRILRSSGAPMHLMGAAVLTALGKTPDEKKLLEAERILQEREPEDSPIRGRIKSVTTVHMSLAESEEDYYNELRRTHDLIHVNRGGDDERYYMAAMMMSDKISNMMEILQLVDRTAVIHESMGKSFMSLEDRSSYVTAAFAAVNGVLNARKYVEDVNLCKEYLTKAGALESESMGELSMLLAISPADAELICDLALKILEALRAKGLDFGSPEEAAMLSFLSALNMPADEIAKAVYDADEFLAQYSGFNEGRGLILRRVYASIFVILAYAGDHCWKDFSGRVAHDREVIKRMVLMQSQSVMHIQMEYVEVEDLHI